MSMASLCTSVRASTKAAVTNASISITFNETLKGYSWEGGTENDTIRDFQIAYEKGKIANEIMSFSLQVDIVDVAKWRVDPLHNAVCAGHVVDTNITNNRSILVSQGGALHVFDGGVHKDTHELRMEYILPFTENGRNYTLYGVKHLPGNDCLGLLSQSTTLYVHVYDDDDDAKKIKRTGIVKIGPLDVVSLVESMRVHGGTVADQIKGFLTFGLLLVGDILQNCLAKAAHDTKFWYVWASDGNTGFILDLIKRPQTLELRLAQFMGNSTTNMTSSVSVHRQTLPLDQFSVGTDNITVNFGSDMKMSSNGVIGTVDGVFVNVSFNLNGRSNKFLPPELAVLDLNAVLPTPMSEYGQVGNWPSGGMVGEHVLRSAVPVVRTNYNIPYGLDSNVLKWSMVSASSFEDDVTGASVDLQIEMVAMPLRLLPFLPPMTWIAPTYIRVDGHEYHLNMLEESTEMISIKKFGALTSDNLQRYFVIEIQLPATTGAGVLHISLNCSSPVSDFAMLDKEGDTYIHSTVRGSCFAAVTRIDLEEKVTTTTCSSKNKNLLEIKN